ncbi:MAG: hypothetical protein A2381_05615 [Bdellovibrionales bacterium RIFOXYB1_FULL_37_110]|nr:MAG: hypothetical protein A2417_06230 [Bdellovibrionales bacterium RIFOXYC1_FULL_37_79]OFZ58529.1 MAG: hypothetical protein A2381_05615 [Bdellovibrionales bacterium RIFOXYB1_FULL_37_110]OFZ63749.1 MAG: hypothetical protein A2577_07365 [Bdellovibrionales bacterium RIFOXYD1_FULL_36_51]
MLSIKLSLLKTVCLIIFTQLFISSYSFAIPGSMDGGGGNAESLKFTMIANRALMIVQENQAKFPEVSYSDFQNAIKKTKVKITNEELILDGEKKEAINYPKESLIKVNRFAFRALTSNVLAQIALVVHEYLGILAIDDPNYHISSRIGGILESQEGSMFKWSCAAMVVCRGRYLGSWIKGEGNTAGEAWGEATEMGKDFCQSLKESVWGIVTSITSGQMLTHATPATMVNACLKN